MASAGKRKRRDQLKLLEADFAVPSIHKGHNNLCMILKKGMAKKADESRVLSRWCCSL